MEEGVKILIFEDSVVDNLLIENSLLRSGQNFVIRSVSSKLQFLDAVSGFQPHIVIAGYPQQTDSGAEAIKAVKQTLPDAACFFITGKGGEKISEVFNGQVFGYISKDNLNSLVPAINRALAQQDEKNKLKAAEERIKARLAQQALVNEISSMMLAGASIRALFKKASGLIMDITGAKYCAVYKSVSAKYLELVHSEGIENSELVIDVKTLRGAEEILSGNEPFLIVRSDNDNMVLPGKNEINSNLILPIKGRKKVFGIHCAYCKEKPELDKDDIYLLSSICNILGAAIDRKRSEKMIKSPEKEQQAYPDVSGFISFTLDTKGNVTEINEKGCEILGYGKDSIIGKNWFANFVPKEVGAELEQSFVKHLAQGREISYQDEYKIITASGEEKNYVWNNATVKNREGLISHIICSGEDGPGKKAAPHKTFSQFDILDNLNDAVVAINANCIIEYWNKAAEDIFGYTAEELKGKSPDIFYFNDTLENDRAKPFNEILSHSGHFVYWKGKTKAGEEVTLHAGISKLPDSQGNITMVICMGRVLPVQNEVKEAENIVSDDTEEALKQAEIRYRSLFDNNPMPMWIFDRQSLHILDVNDAAIEHYGYTKEEFIDMNINALRVSDGASSFIDDLNIWSIEGYFKYDVKHKKQSGEAIDVEITSMPVVFEGKRAGLAVVNDITSRKLAEEALLKSETRYGYLFVSNPLPMWVLDNETLRFLAVNDAAIAHYGYSREEFLKMNASGIKTDERTATAKDAWEQGMGKHKKKDNSLIDVEITSHIIDFDGRPARLVLANDVTERLRAGDVTRQSEANLKSLIENTQDSILSLDKDLKIIFINTSAKKNLAKMSGVEIKKGMKLFDAVPHHELPVDYNAVITALNGKRSILELAREKGGHNYFYEVSVNPIITDNGEVAGVSCFSRNITERKMAELNIRRSEEKFRRLIETMHEGVVYSDYDGKIQFVNTRFCEVTGYSPEELLGKQSVKNILAKDSADLLNQKAELRKKGIGDQYELKMRKKSGETVWALVNGVPLLDDRGEVAGAMDTYIDITDMKLAETRLKSINQELNTFVYKSSHDLKGPLASIKGLTSIAKYEVTDEAGLRYLGLITQSTDKLDQILTDLLETVKIKETAVVAEKIDVNALIKAVMDSLEHSPDFERVSFRFNIKPDLFFYSDKKILISVMQNMIDNGVKYRRQEIDNSFVAISIEENYAGIIIKVEDNGLGIPDEIQDKVFDMFYRGHSESKGTGLGLYIVKNAIEKLGGTIEIQSKTGQGTIFTIFLPNLAKN